MLEETSQERDLGVTMLPNLEFDNIIGNVTGKPNKIFGNIARSDDNEQKDGIIQLFKSLMRPHLEYEVQAWRAYE